METDETVGMMKDLQDYSLLAHNTFGIEAACSRYLEYDSTEDACRIAEMLCGSKEPLLIIGGGSNLLLTHDFQGIVVRSAIKGYEVVEDGEATGRVLLRVGSGETWDDVVDYCVNQGWQGAENLSLIPGDVGASAVQNIGAYGAEAGNLIQEIEAVELATGNICVIPAAECEYGYRQSKFKKEWKNRYLITHVTYRLSRDMKQMNLSYGNIRSELDRRGIGEPTLRQLRGVIIAIRQEKLPDPKVQGNAGSFFMNPVVDRSLYESLQKLYPDMPHYSVDDRHEKIPAGWLIDQCGWKGRSLGRAGVHDRQALVLVNRGGATGEEIVKLSDTIRQDVYERFGIRIYPEVNIV